ncbi:MAG: SRPBCC domain-containing protein [Paracoccaceae bacterium]
MTLHHETLVLEREYPHPKARVMEAFSTVEGYTAWSSPAPGAEVTVDPFEFHVGGQAVVRMDAGEEGGVWVNTDRFVDIGPDHIVQACTLEGPPGLECASTVTLEFTETPAGCKLSVTEQGTFFMGDEGAMGHQEGWTAMLASLAEWLDSRA